MEFWIQNPLREFPTTFVIPFRATFSFGASQSELSIKSYDHLKFFAPKFLQLKIYGKSIQSKNYTIKYILIEVVAKTFWVKNEFLTFCKEKR